MRIAVEGNGHYSDVLLTDQQEGFIEEIAAESAATFAQAVQTAIEQQRQVWQAEGGQDGNNDGA